MKLTLISIALISTISLVNNPGGQIIGTWQGTSMSGHPITVEFSEEGNYNLVLNGQLMTNNNEEFGQIKYELTTTDGPMEIRLYDERTRKEYSRLQATIKENDKLELVLFVNNEAADRLILSRM